MVNKWRIPDEHVQRILELEQTTKRLKETALESYKSMWNEIYKVTGLTDDNAYSLDISNADIGIIVVKEGHHQTSAMIDKLLGKKIVMKTIDGETGPHAEGCDCEEDKTTVH